MKYTRSQCACCKQVFAGTKAFDAHRVGPYTRKQQKRRCLSSREMRLRGMRQNEQGWWMLISRTQTAKGETENIPNQAG
jgi:hypothetical protein